MGGYSTEHELQREKISISEVLRIMGFVDTAWKQGRGRGEEMYFPKEI